MKKKQEHSLVYRIRDLVNRDAVNQFSHSKWNWFLPGCRCPCNLSCVRWNLTSKAGMHSFMSCEFIIPIDPAKRTIAFVARTLTWDASHKSSTIHEVQESTIHILSAFEMPANSVIEHFSCHQKHCFVLFFEVLLENSHRHLIRCNGQKPFFPHSNRKNIKVKREWNLFPIRDILEDNWPVWQHLRVERGHIAADCHFKASTKAHSFTEEAFDPIHV